ncbi:MAG: carboxypeptidase regulatory-like domain-containing protein [Flavobacteriales bacterium]|nr:carboxypeptidase regulatory-like domain-containing protein [Flavobacteriales bacterium]
MRTMLTQAIAALLCTVATPASAAHLRLVGVVTDKATASPLADASVRIYKNGEKLRTLATTANGRYEVLLDNNADYVIRFALPGHVSKCYTVSTHGPEWQGDHSVKEVFIEMTMLERLPELDLSLFDLPMGIATFDPLNGRLSWDEGYDERIRPEITTLMAAYERILTGRQPLARNDS